MMYKPLVSVITQILNANTYLEECIRSVLSQSYPYIEHVFADGGSTDGTLDTLSSYQAKFPDRIRFLSRKDKNCSDGWNNGARMVKGEILGWLGADDTYTPRAVQSAVEFFAADPSAHFVFGGCNYINEKSEIIKTIVTKDFVLKEAINDACYIPCSSAFFKRAIIEKIGYRDTGELNSEVDYWIRIGKEYKIHRIENVLSNFRQHNEKCEFNKQRFNQDFYNFAYTSYAIGKRYGASAFSHCARRYYLATIIRPLQPVLDPIFHFMTTGEANRGKLLVKMTRPFHPLIRFAYQRIVGSKSLGQNKTARN